MNEILETIEKDFKGRAVDNWGACTYLTGDGKKCAIGLFLNEKHKDYKATQMYKGVVTDLIHEYDKSIIKFLSTENVNKLKQLQRVHDSRYSECRKYNDDYILANKEDFQFMSLQEQKMMLQFSCMMLFSDV